MRIGKVNAMTRAQWLFVVSIEQSLFPQREPTRQATNRQQKEHNFSKYQQPKIAKDIYTIFWCPLGAMYKVYKVLCTSQKVKWAWHTPIYRWPTESKKGKKN